MNKHVAISVHNVTKKYRLFASPKERLKEALHPFRKRYHEEFWALKGVSFDIMKGQTVGILGRNGSGKSTLLQIISSVLSPTSGSANVYGRVAPILELGTGFNPEFTGRDNVILYGVIQGIPREEMLARIPEIEAFADVGEFFDQPIKIYSSGMYLRVAFAAALGLIPDIMIVDEALAVGDAKFQHKCFNKFRDLIKSGKTIVVVSHDVSMLLKLCEIGIVLEGGEVHFQGEIASAVNRYHELLFSTNRRYDGGDKRIADTTIYDTSENEGISPTTVDNHSYINISSSIIDINGDEDRCLSRKNYNPDEVRLGDGRAQILDYAVVAGSKVDPPIIPYNCDLHIYYKILFLEDIENASIGFGLVTKEGIYIYGTNSYLQGLPLIHGHVNELLILRLSWRSELAGGDYFLNLGCTQINADNEYYLDVRRSLAHLRFAETDWCRGFVGVKSNMNIMMRKIISR